VQPIRKLPTLTVNNQGKYRNLNKLKEEKSQPNDHIKRGNFTWGSYVPDPGPDKSTTRKIGNRKTNTNGSVWQGDVATVGPPETRAEGSACHPEATEAAGMKPLPETQGKATHAAMTISQAPRSEGNRGPGCRSSRLPARKRSSRLPADPTVRRSKEGWVDPNPEVRGKATEA